MSKEIQFHSDGFGRTSHPAINVKFYGQFPDGGTEQDRNDAWESVVESFWEQATELAHERGYSGVFSEGRSGGWLVPFYQTTSEGKNKFHNWPGQGGNLGYPSYPDVTRLGERSRFLAFQRRVEKMLAGVPDMLKAEIAFRMELRREAAEEAIAPDAMVKHGDTI